MTAQHDLAVLQGRLAESLLEQLEVPHLNSVGGRAVRHLHVYGRAEPPPCRHVDGRAEPAPRRPTCDMTLRTTARRPRCAPVTTYYCEVITPGGEAHLAVGVVRRAAGLVRGGE